VRSDFSADRKILILKEINSNQGWHAGCNCLVDQGIQKSPLSNADPIGRSFRMNRQRAAHLYLSPVHIQQGVFAVLALLITLIGGQQFLCREQSQQPEAPHLSIRHPTQTHFSAVGSGQADSPPMRMMDVDQAGPVGEIRHQERWVF
jgi:hypothetical protein